MTGYKIMKSIEFQNVIKHYWLFNNDIKKIPWLFTHKGHSMVKKAVDDVSFNVNKGEVLGIIGRNGSGKSTILKLIAEITKPNSGNIFVDGRVTSLINLGAGLIPDFTGRENLIYKASLMGLGKEYIESKMDEIIAFADIGDYIDIPIKTYSTGMKTRLGFALAAHSDPEILLIDEIFAVGDRDFQEKSGAKTKELLNANKTVIITSHSEGIIKKFCTKCLYLNKGKIEYDGDPETAFSMYNKK